MADYMTRSAFDMIDWDATYTNCIVSGNPEAGKIPAIMPSEEESVRAAVYPCAGIDVRALRVVRIKDTLHLIDILVSESSLSQCQNPNSFLIRES